MEFHPAAALFPLMEGVEFQALVEDIRANGVREPIALEGGKIIDGRNRYRACQELGIAPPTREWSEGSATAFVVSMNLHRRHLTASQRAVIALEVLPHLEAEAHTRMPRGQVGENSPTRKRTKATDEAAEIVGVDGSYVRRAKKLREEAPEKLEEVRAGTKSIMTAIREVDREPREKPGRYPCPVCAGKGWLNQKPRMEAWRP